MGEAFGSDVNSFFLGATNAQLSRPKTIVGAPKSAAKAGPEYLSCRATAVETIETKSIPRIPVTVIENFCLLRAIMPPDKPRMKARNPRKANAG